MADIVRFAAREPTLTQAQQRALIDLAPDGIFVSSIDGRFTFVNQAGCRLLGYSCEEILGMRITDLIPAEDVERLLASKAQMLRGASHVGEWHARRKDGSWVPLEVHANILPDGQWQAFARDLSERKRDEERLGLALQGSNAALWDTDLRSGEVVLAPAWSEMLGGPPVETRTTVRELTNLLHPDDAASTIKASIEVLKGERPHYACEHRVRALDGRCIWIASRGKVTERDPASGRALRMVGTNIDISERKAHEAEREALFRQSEADRRWLQAVLDTMPIAMVLFEPGGRIVFNHRTEELLGINLSAGGGSAQYADRILHADGTPLPREQLPSSRVLREGVTLMAVQYGVQRPDGTRVPVLASAAPIRDAAGAIIGAAAFFQDVSEFMRVEEEMRTHERLLRSIFELLPVGVWIADKSGRIVSHNPAGLQIWKGARYVDVPNFGEYKGWWIDTGKLIAAEEWALARALVRGETSTGELVRIQCFDGSFKTIINSAAPLRDEKGEIAGAIVVNEDVTSLQHTQEQLRAAVRDREEILAIVTHDLRNPLAGLMMGAVAAERKARELPGGDTVRDLAATLVDITERMSGLVDDLLAVAVASSSGQSLLKLAPVPASSLMARAAEAARPLLAKESLELIVNVTGELPSVHADADRILRVFANLLDNALKFTSPPGRITLSADSTTGGVRFSVANTGTPLAEEHLREMFKPFWQAGRDRRGAGLGLAICRSIVEAHGGSIWTEPAEGQRVRVCFVLPRHPSASAG